MRKTISVYADTSVFGGVFDEEFKDSSMKTKKTFDCVRMKRQGAEKVMRQLEGKSLQEQLEYREKGTEDLKKLQQKIRRTGRHS